MRGGRGEDRPARAFLIVLSAAAICAASIACSGRMILTDQAAARRLAASLHVHFVQANEAANRAVMSDTDAASAAAADDARHAADNAQRDLDQLAPIVQSLGYGDEIELVRQVLPLAVENTNVKAERLAFGSAREIVQMSRRNTNVRSLAVTLGRKRVVAAECEHQLRALEEALAAHTFKMTK